MEILLKRIAKKPSYTIGKLYVNGEFFCDTLEDTDRGLKSTMSLDEIKRIKIQGKTAIPTGRYQVTLSIKSPKYSKKKFFNNYCNAYMPRILNVKGYEGILVHPGNTAEDTEGCILVGQNKVVGKVINSTDTWTKLYEILKNVDDKDIIMITIQ